MKVIKYRFLSCEIDHGTEVEQIFLDKALPYSEEAEELARAEAYNGVYTIEDDGVEAVSVIHSTVLWENASPESEFPEQTIALDLNGYDAVEIVFWSPSSNEYYSADSIYSTVQIGVGASMLVDKTGLGGWSLSNSYVVFDYRQVNVFADSIAFSYGLTRLNANDNIPITVANNMLVPQIIRGIKRTKVVEVKLLAGKTICGTFLCGEAVCG